MLPLFSSHLILICCVYFPNGIQFWHCCVWFHVYYQYVRLFPKGVQFRHCHNNTMIEIIKQLVFLSFLFLVACNYWWSLFNVWSIKYIGVFTLGLQLWFFLHLVNFKNIPLSLKNALECSRVVNFLRFSHGEFWIFWTKSRMI